MVDKSLLFDNEYYYELYPDVLRAVEFTFFKDGYDHFKRHGKSEGRLSKFKSEIGYKIDEVNEGWSDHLTLEGYVEPLKPIIHLNMIDVPKQFQPVQSVEYPQGNKTPFERYFTDKFKELKPNTFRTYLPIHWTAYYVNNKYGSDLNSIAILQKYIGSLDKTKKYFTIVQYDDGILNDIEDLDILVYSMGCKKEGYYPIPLICQPTNNNPQDIVEKDIEFSFIGANTHPIRETLIDSLHSTVVKFNSILIGQYYNILKRSTFALCPRGYGVTSFRLYEAMAYGCIPVYISDEFWEAFNLPFTEYGIKITEDQIKDIQAILSKVDIPKMQAKVKEYYEKYFVYSQVVDSIIKTLMI